MGRRLPSSRSLPLFSSSQPEVHHAKQRSFLEASTNFEFICEPQHTSSHHFDLFRGHGDFDVASLSPHSECFSSFDVALCFRTLASLLSASAASVSVALCHFFFSQACWSFQCSHHIVCARVV